MKTRKKIFIILPVIGISIFTILFFPINYEVPCDSDNYDAMGCPILHNLIDMIDYGQPKFTLGPEHDVLQQILTECDGGDSDLIVYTFQNDTHNIDSVDCEWKKYTEFDELTSKGCPQFCPKEKSISTVIISKGAVIEGHEMLIPEIITIQIGINNTVTWINEDDTSHGITSNDGPYGAWGTVGVLKPGESYTHTFDNAGVFPYHGEPHPWMTGTVIVLEE